jgi:hypothetical protein
MNHPQKGTRVTHASSSARKPLLRRGSVAGLAHSGAFRGSGAPSVRLLGLALVLAAAFIALTAVSAQAAPRLFNAQITEAQNGAPLQNPAGLAVDSTDHLWVTEAVGGGTVDKYTSEGAYEAHTESPPWGGTYIESIASSAAAGELFVSDSNADDLWGLNPTDASYSGIDLNSGLGGGCCYIRVAADNSAGDLYVFSSGKVIRIDASGSPVPFTAGAFVPGEENVLTGAETPAGEFGNPEHLSRAGLAVDSAGRLYVADGTHHVVDVFEPSGEIAFAITEAASGEPLGEVSAVAIDPTNGNVLAADPTNHRVDEFTAAGSFLQAISEANGAPFAGPVGLAVDSTGRLYVADAAGNAVDVFGPAVVLPTLIYLPPSGITQSSVTLNAEADPNGGGPIEACSFQYGETIAYGQSTPCSPSAPYAGKTTVSATASLTPGAALHYRLVLANANGTQRGSDQSFGPPQIETGTSAANVSADSADLLAEVNPRGLPTTYRFQYGTTEGYGSETASLPIGSGSSAVSVSQHIQGLQPDTTYHYRVVAENPVSPLGGNFGPDRAFTTQPTTAFPLPDARQYQLVSPPDKHGGVIERISQVGVTEAAASGDAISYLANASLVADPEGGAGFAQMLSRRGPAGWSSANLNNPHARTTGQGTTTPEYRFFSADLSSGLFQPWGLFEPRLSAAASEQTPFLRNLAGCSSACYTPLVTAANALPGFGEERECEEENGIEPVAFVICGPFFIGATPDSRHLALISAAPLFSGAGRGQLYEWSGGVLSQVSLLPENGAGEELPAPEASARLGVGVGLTGGQNAASAKRAISTDGSRVFWGVENNNSSLALYLRDTARGETLQLDLAEAACVEAGECESGGGRFQIAAADGTSVLFTASHRLTADAGGANDLYECRLHLDGAGKLACDLTDLTPEIAGEAASVQGSVLGASEDDSSVYFIAKGVLATNVVNHGSGPESAQSGQPNLYLRRGGATNFIARLAEGDLQDWAPKDPWQPVRVSSNGRWLAFMSERPLTGYDNRDAVSGRPDAEIYEYDANAGRLSCASCNPSGARPHGAEFAALARGELLVSGQPLWEGPGWVAAMMPQSPSFELHESLYQSRALSDSGRLFFNALDPLVSQDVNANWDVYQSEPAGVGGCSAATPGFQAATGACLGLLSAGTSGKQSAFLDASETGGDVFLLTSSRLVPSQDVDAARDVYDAHECSAEVPCFPPPPPSPPACEGDACQQPATPPNHPTPGTLLLNGPENVLECPKGKVKRSGKCVAAKKSKKHKHHKKSKKRHAKVNRGGAK